MANKKTENKVDVLESVLAEAGKIKEFNETTHAEVLRNRILDHLMIAGLYNNYEVKVKVKVDIEFIGKSK